MSRIHYIISTLNLLLILLAQNVKCRAPRIHQGMQADSSFNFVVKIMKKDSRRLNATTAQVSGSACTGTLVTNQHVVTAAHCVKTRDDTYYPGEYSVFSGAIDLDSPNGTWTLVKEIYVPSYFRKYDLYYNNYIGDIAVLKLEQPLPLDKISMLRLPEPHQDPPSGMRAIVAGYGYYSDLHVENIKVFNGQGNLQTKQELKGEYPKILQYAISEILSQEECKAIHMPKNNLIRDSHLCARMIPVNKNSTYYGVCMGDSGGPLFIGNELIGVVSHNADNTCNENFRPEIYTRVSHFVNFIISVINGDTNNLCVSAHIPKSTMTLEEEVMKETLFLMDQCVPIS